MKRFKLVLFSCILTLLFGTSVQASSKVTGNGGCVIRYMDGCGGEAFKDQVFYADETDSTPAFDGTPKREGHTFTGWYPALQEKVESDQTYTAQWKKDGEAAGTDTGNGAGQASGDGSVGDQNASASGGSQGNANVNAAVSDGAKGDQSVPDVDTWDVNLGVIVAVIVLLAALLLVLIPWCLCRMLHMKR